MRIELHIWILTRASTKEKSHHSSGEPSSSWSHSVPPYHGYFLPEKENGNK